MNYIVNLLLFCVNFVINITAYFFLIALLFRNLRLDHYNPYYQFVSYFSQNILLLFFRIFHVNYFSFMRKYINIVFLAIIYILMMLKIILFNLIFSISILTKLHFVIFFALINVLSLVVNLYIWIAILYLLSKYFVFMYFNPGFVVIKNMIVPLLKKICYIFYIKYDSYLSIIILILVLFFLQTIISLLT